MLLGPLFRPILPDWTIPLPMALLATVMTVPLVSFPILCQECRDSSISSWIHLLFLLQQSCREFVEIDLLLLLQTDNKISIPLRQTIENNSQLDVVLQLETDC